MAIRNIVLPFGRHATSRPSRKNGEAEEPCGRFRPNVFPRLTLIVSGALNWYVRLVTCRALDWPQPEPTVTVDERCRREKSIQLAGRANADSGTRGVKPAAEGSAIVRAPAASGTQA